MYQIILNFDVCFSPAFNAYYNGECRNEHGTLIVNCRTQDQCCGAGAGAAQSRPFWPEL